MEYSYKCKWNKYKNINIKPKIINLKNDIINDNEKFTKRLIKLKSKKDDSNIYTLPIEFNDYWNISQFKNDLNIIEFDVESKHLEIIVNYLNFYPVIINSDHMDNFFQFVTLLGLKKLQYIIIQLIKDNISPKTISILFDYIYQDIRLKDVELLNFCKKWIKNHIDIIVDLRYVKYIKVKVLRYILTLDVLVVYSESKLLEFLVIWLKTNNMLSDLYTAKAFLRSIIWSSVDVKSILYVLIAFNTLQKIPDAQSITELRGKTVSSISLPVCHERIYTSI